MEKLGLREGRLFKVVQLSWWQSRVGTQVCPFAPCCYLKDSCPSLRAGHRSREEARGRESQEFDGRAGRGRVGSLGVASS